MQAKRGLLSLLVMFTLVFALACNRAGTRSDTELATDVQNKIRQDSNIHAEQVQVQAASGVVTLTGTVPTEMDRAAAANQAAQVSGVSTVVNNLQVQGEGATAPTQPAAPAMGNTTQQATTRPGTRPRVFNQGGATTPATNTAQPAANAAPVQAATIRNVTIPAGTPIHIRLIDDVDSEKNQTGDTIRASLAQPILVDGQAVVGTDADVQLKLTDVKSAGHFKGQSQVVMTIDHLVIGGQSYPVSSNNWTREGGSRGKRTAATVGGGAALGAIIGGIAGGGKGAAIGAAAGAGAGTGVQAVTKAEQIRLPSETLLEFTLQQPLTVTPSSGRR